MKSNLNNHEKILKKNVFFIKSKWPHFDILFKDIKSLAKNKKIKHIVSLERGNLYGSISLFAPFFENKNFISVDCSTEKIKKRGSYNKEKVNSNYIIKKKIDYFRNYKNLKLKKSSADLVLIPNLMHHIFDHIKLLEQCKSILKKDGLIYIFEPLIRELHQKPDDYFRFTPYSLERIFKNLGLKKIKLNYSGGPFTAAYYCLDQALEYIPPNLKKAFKKDFTENKLKKLIKLENKYKKNLSRKNTTFPVSFSILARK